jgi:hypothetical protein
MLHNCDPPFFRYYNIEHCQKIVDIVAAIQQSRQSFRFIEHGNILKKMPDFASKCRLRDSRGRAISTTTVNVIDH